MIRKKRKPDTLKVNFVKSAIGKSGALNIKAVTYPFVRSSPHSPCGPSVTTNPLPSSSTVCNPAGVDMNIDMNMDTGHTDYSSQGQQHKVRKKKAAEAWSNVRTKIVPAMLTASGFPASTFCSFCKIQLICAWCPDCGPAAYFCQVL